MATDADLQLVVESLGISHLIAEMKQLNANMAAMVGNANKAAGAIDDVDVESQKASKATSGLSSSLGGLGGVLSGLGLAVGAAEIFSLGKSAVQSAMAYETLSIQFEVFLGSAEKAKTVLADLNKFSIETPFTPDQVNAAGRSLIAFGVAQKDLLPTMQKIGDVSAAVGKDYNELATIYGKAKTAGVLMAEDINQLTEAGIPIIDEFAKILGVGADQVKKLGSEGKIHFSDLETAFANMTGEGGRFNGMMDKMSQTTEGLLSSIEGKLQDELRAIGQAMLPTIRTIMEGFEPAMAILKDTFKWVYAAIGPLVTSIGDIAKAFGLGSSEGNGFVAVIEVLSTVLKVAFFPFKAITSIIGFFVGIIAKAVTGISNFINESPNLLAAVNTLLTPFRMLGDAISWVGESLGLTDSHANDAKLAYDGVVKSLGNVAAQMGATGAQTKAFAQSFDMATIQGMSTAEAMNEIKRQFTEYLKPAEAADVVTGAVSDNMSKLTGNAKAATKAVQELGFGYMGMADPFILQAAMEQVNAEKLRADALAETAKEASDLAWVMQEGANMADPFVQSLVDSIPKVNALQAKLQDLGKTIKSDLKSAFIDFGISAVTSMGKAIGAGESVGAAFREAVGAMMVEIPRLVGMAMITAATNPTNSAIAVPLLVGGLALLGISGLMSGLQEKNAAKEADVSGIGGGANMRTGGNSPVAEGLASAGATANQPIILNLDGRKVAEGMYPYTQKERMKRG